MKRIICIIELNKPNHEFLQEKGDDIVKKRVKWLGHVWKTGPNSVIYEIFGMESRTKKEAWKTTKHISSSGREIFK